jgi:hypothetical protein
VQGRLWPGRSDIPGDAARSPPSSARILPRAPARRKRHSLGSTLGSRCRKSAPIGPLRRRRPKTARARALPTKSLRARPTQWCRTSGILDATFPFLHEQQCLLRRTSPVGRSPREPDLLSGSRVDSIRPRLKRHVLRWGSPGPISTRPSFIAASTSKPKLTTACDRARVEKIRPRGMSIPRCFHSP